MKLLDLEPMLVQYGDASHTIVATVAEADGVMFGCPNCGHHSVLCWFASRPRVPASAEPLPRWSAAGATVADLTLQPSIQINGACDWHGWVTSGDAT